MQKLNITQAAKEKGCSRQAMHHLVNAGRVNVIEENRKRLVLIDEKFHSVRLKPQQVSTKDEKISHLETEIALLKESQNELQKEIVRLKEQMRGSRAAEPKATANKPQPKGLIKLGQIILGFKIIKKTVRNRLELHGYKRLDGKQCYVYLCSQTEIISTQSAQAKIEAYLARHQKKN